MPSGCSEVLGGRNRPHDAHFLLHARGLSTECHCAALQITRTSILNSCFDASQDRTKSGEVSVNARYRGWFFSLLRHGMVRDSRHVASWKQLTPDTAPERSSIKMTTPKKRDGHSDREASEASRPVWYREFTVRSFVRSVPCSHRALQSATDSAPLTPLQQPSPLRSVTAPPLARKTESNAIPTKYRGRWLERNGAIVWWLFDLGAESAGCPIVNDWLRALRARAVVFFERAHRRRDASRPLYSPSGNHRRTNDPESCVATPCFATGRCTATTEQGETSMFTRLYSCQPDGKGLK